MTPGRTGVYLIVFQRENRCVSGYCAWQNQRIPNCIRMGDPENKRVGARGARRIPLYSPGCCGALIGITIGGTGVCLTVFAWGPGGLSGIASGGTGVYQTVFAW